MAPTLRSSGPSTVAGATLLGIAFIFGLMVYGVLSYPESIHGAGGFSLTVVTGGLLAYAGVMLWSRRSRPAAVRTAMAQGAIFGLLLAGGAWLNMALEHFVALGATGNMVRGVGLWALMFVIFGAAGSASFQRSGSLGLAVFSSIWSAIVGTVATLIFGFGLATWFMPFMLNIVNGAYEQSGMSDPQAFVIRNTLDSASMHLLIVPFVAGVFGLIGGFVCSRLQPLHRKSVLLIAVLEMALLLAGMAALYMVSVLARPERPPFVMSGLLALGLAMACAHPVFTAIRRPGTAR